MLSVCWHMAVCTQGDPTYLVVNKEGNLENYGVNAVCTHLGCVVPWNGVGFFTLPWFFYAPFLKLKHMYCGAQRTTTCWFFCTRLFYPRLRTSLCALATALSTMPRARRFAAQLLWCV